MAVFTQVTWVSLAVSEFGQLGARRHDPHAARAEIYQQSGVNLDADDPAEAVRVVGNLIPHLELLKRQSDWGAEGTGGKVTPGRGVGWLHLSSSMRPLRHTCDPLPLFVEPSVLTNTGPLCEAATISPVVTWGYRSGPRWLMALADGNAAERLGAFRYWDRIRLAQFVSW
jgi:hypothetical protein